VESPFSPLGFPQERKKDSLDMEQFIAALKIVTKKIYAFFASNFLFKHVSILKSFRGLFYNSFCNII
jgi:hypothetical protein